MVAFNAIFEANNMWEKLNDLPLKDPWIFPQHTEGIPEKPLGRHFTDMGHHSDLSQIIAYTFAFITPPANSKEAIECSRS